MKFETYLLLAVLIFGIFKTRRTVQQSQSAKERFFAIRASAFTWLVGILLFAAFVFLPNKQRWRNARARLRQENQERVDLERMKRVN